MIRKLVGATALALGLVAPAVAQQNLPLGGSGGGSVEIEASESLEWRQDLETYVARGDARLVRDDVTINADVLTAHYREAEDGATEIWRATATGNVIIETVDAEAQADTAVYDMEQSVVVLRGEDLRLESADGVVTARDTLEYWPDRQLAVARGDAVVQQGDQTVEADVVAGEFTEDENGELQLTRVTGTGNVVITTPTDVAVADEAVYDLLTEIATLDGSVRLTRGDNQLNGDFAEINLQTGVSRLLARPGGGGRVSGLLVPEEGEQQADGDVDSDNGQDRE